METVLAEVEARGGTRETFGLFIISRFLSLPEAEKHQVVADYSAEILKTDPTDMVEVDLGGLFDEGGA